MISSFGPKIYGPLPQEMDTSIINNKYLTKFTQKYSGIDDTGDFSIKIFSSAIEEYFFIFPSHINSILCKQKFLSLEKKQPDMILVNPNSKTVYIIEMKCSKPSLQQLKSGTYWANMILFFLSNNPQFDFVEYTPIYVRWRLDVGRSKKNQVIECTDKSTPFLTMFGNTLCVDLLIQETPIQYYQ